MKRRKQRSALLLTKRALSDLAEIEAHSIVQWGRRVASKYLKAIESGIGLIGENPEILRSMDGLPSELQFHRVNKHWLVCDVALRSIVVLTVIHASMEVSARLAELVPQLCAEVALLHGQLESSRKRG
ncbi:MAG TPA: type II toxin-antitoxin system RelE/ParE family toxin [Vicinamibacteria bacterium]|nr:type II toxin-antitoxin system RelE/ParE family toxin [Vicinamibacteria bacterium]